MEQPLNDNRTFMAYLLPNFCRPLGFGILAAGILPLLIIELSQWGAIRQELRYGSAMGVIAQTVILLGLIFIAFAREKAEDEITLLMRLKAIGFAFLVGAFYVILNPIYDLVTGKAPAWLNGTQIMIGMLVLYLFSYLRQKKSN